MSHPRRQQLAVAVAAAFALTACSGGGGPSSPTEPKGPQAALATQYGTVTVLTNGNTFDAGRAEAAIQAGYDKARAQIGGAVDGIRLDGMVLAVEPGVFNGAVGQYHPNSDTVRLAQGVENVITHELQHRFCHNLGHSGACCTYQDHSGGYDLQCRQQ
jgi:hypothetical protein